jgi:hypothetical protein
MCDFAVTTHPSRIELWNWGALEVKEEVLEHLSWTTRTTASCSPTQPLRVVETLEHPKAAPCFEEKPRWNL